MVVTIKSVRICSLHYVIVEERRKTNICKLDIGGEREREDGQRL